MVVMQDELEQVEVGEELLTVESLLHLNQNQRESFTMCRKGVHEG